MSRPVYSIPRAERNSSQLLGVGEPAKYNPTVDFVKPVLPAFSFGKGPRASEKPNRVPGPDTYNPSTIIQKKSPAFSISGKHELKNKENFPGPGNYNPNTNFNLNSLTYSMPKGPRAKLENLKNPAPGQYDPTVSFAKVNSPLYSFGKEPKKDRQLSAVPGPGTYAPANPLRIIGGQLGRETRKAEVNLIPGPGTYNADFSSVILKTNPAAFLKSN